MNNCANHSDVAAERFCRTCGKPLCNACTRDVRGVIYCETCLAERMGAAASVPPTGYIPSARRPSPGLAAALGFIPGVGAMYNGQFLKGFLQALGFVILLWLADRAAPFGFLIAVYFAYLVIDSYKTAEALARGLPPPDFLQLERWFGPGVTQSADSWHTTANPYRSDVAAGQAAAPPPAANAVPPPAWEPADVAPPQPASNIPLGAVLLILVGVLFLLNSLGLAEFGMGRFWPLILIAIGGWMFYRRWTRAS
jgi:TM2 domain-containing membrane protein YozV